MIKRFKFQKKIRAFVTVVVIAWSMAVIGGWSVTAQDQTPAVEPIAKTETAETSWVLITPTCSENGNAFRIPKVTTHLNQLATIKMANEIKWLKDPKAIDVGIVLEVMPSMSEGIIYLEGKLRITIWADEGTAGKNEQMEWLYTSVREARFRCMVKDAETPVKLPPFKANGKTLEFTLQACLVDHEAKPITEVK